MLLLDEPLGALDKKLREDMQIELRQLQRSVGITFIFVTHDQEEALSMSDRIAVMERGSVLQIADPKTLLRTPGHARRRRFIGTMNFIEGRVTAILGANTATVETQALNRVTVTLRERVKFDAGARVLVAIRPEKLILISDISPGVRAGRLISAAYLGDRSHFQVRVEGRSEPIVVSSQNTATGDDRRFEAGETVHLGWTAEGPILLPP